MGQRLVLDIALELDDCDAAVTDRLEDTIDYGDVCQEAALAAQERSYRTLERLCAAIADRLIDAVRGRLRHGAGGQAGAADPAAGGGGGGGAVARARVSAPVTGYLGLGSNVGDRLGHLRAAREALGRHGAPVTASSSVYETEPIGEITEQRDFLNACVRVETRLDPDELLAACKAVERELGRTSGRRPSRAPPDRRRSASARRAGAAGRPPDPPASRHPRPPLRAAAAARARPRPAAARRDPASRRAVRARGPARRAGGQPVATSMP